jgi:hypothetical protein
MSSTEESSSWNESLSIESTPDDPETSLTDEPVEDLLDFDDIIEEPKVKAKKTKASKESEETKKSKARHSKDQHSGVRRRDRNRRQIKEILNDHLQKRTLDPKIRKQLSQKIIATGQLQTFAQKVVATGQQTLTSSASSPKDSHPENVPDTYWLKRTSVVLPDPDIATSSSEKQQLQALYSYVPRLVIREFYLEGKVELPSFSTFNSCVLMADISGFTMMSERYFFSFF